MNKCFTRSLAILLAACLFMPAALAENVEDTLTVGLVSTRTAEIRPLDPVERDVISLYGMVYESMVTIDDNGLPQPLLASTWTESGNGSTWTFTLRENITFSDGTPLTANDVVASCQHILTLSENNQGFYQNIHYLIKSIKAQDERTVVVKAARSYYGLLYAMTFPVVPANWVDSPSPPGTGPYMVTSFEPGNYMYLQINPGWWQTAPQVQQIMANFFLNNKELITAYEYGRVDTAFTRAVAAAQYKSGINSLSIPYSTRQLEVLLLNHRELGYPLDNERIREAVRYAINVPLISQNAYMGMTIAANTPTPSDSWLYHDQESTFAYNPDKARAILAEEGWVDLDNDGVLDKVVEGADKPKRLKLRLFVYEDPENDVRFETADMIVEMLKAVNISATVEAMDQTNMKEKLEAGNFDMALCAFQMDVVPDYGFFLIKGNKQNYGRYVSSEMGSLFTTLRSSYTQQDFAYTSQAIQQQFANDIPFICLFYRAGAILTRKMYTTVRSFREYELLRGIEAFGR